MAYNMVMSIISCTQQQAQFYFVFLFKEDPAKVSTVSALLQSIIHNFNFASLHDIIVLIIIIGADVVG